MAKLFEEHPDRVQSVIFVTRGGCAPIPGIEPKAPPLCEEMMTRGLEIARKSEIGTIIVGAQWMKYFMSEKYIFRSGNEALSLDVPSRGASLAFDSLARLFRGWVSSGKRAILLLGIPAGDVFRPQELLKRDLIRGNISVREDSSGYEAVLRKLRPVMQELARVAEAEGVRVIDPIRELRLCEGNQCQILNSGGLPIYMDHEHLRPFYVREGVVFMDDILLGH